MALRGAAARVARGDRPSPQAADVLFEFSRLGHDAGYPSVELEARLVALAQAFGFTQVAVSATPTGVELSLGPAASQRISTIRVSPAAVDLDAIARLDALVRRVLDGRADPADAATALDAVRTSPLRRPWAVKLVAYSLASAALVPILGGGWIEMATAAAVGALVAAVLVSWGRAPGTEAVITPVAAIVASFGAGALAHAGVGAAPDIVTAAALVTLLPGMTLTIGMRELATNHLHSGVANTARAIVQLLGLIFGFEIGRSLAVAWFGSVHEVVPHTTFTPPNILAAIAAGVGFTVRLNSHARDTVLICAATSVALVVSQAGASLLGSQAGVFAAALIVGGAGAVAAARLRRTPLVFIVPGVLMLVPSSASFNSVLQLLAHNTLSGVTAGFETLVTAISVAYGLMFSTFLVPRRLSRLGTRDVDGRFTPKG